MASPVVTAIFPVVLSRAFRWPAGQERRVAVAAAVAGVLPDLDVVMYAFGLRESDPLGYKGLLHSFVAAAAIGAVVTWALFRSVRRDVFAFLFGAAAWHVVLDAATATDVGVALLAPFDTTRRFLPPLLPSTQTWGEEFFGYWGLLTVANEILYVIVPTALFVTYLRVDDRTRRRVALEALGWAAAVLLLRSSWPDGFVARKPRVVEPIGTPDAGDPEDLPKDGLPGGRLVMRFDELRARGLFDRALTADRSDVWSSSFFPSWLGGEAGRWRDGTAALVWRTIVGAGPPGEAEARASTWSLAPTEKVDLALGRTSFPATVQALALSHNRRPRPRYWSGRCNGVATAAISEPEPFRVVDVIAKDGTHVRFHPNDVKALLAVAYYETPVIRWVGRFCSEPSFDPGATCSMSPAVLVLAATNRLGIARTPFLVDALVSVAKQYYAVVSARVDVIRAPYTDADVPIAPALAGRVASLADVAITLVLTSTTLGYAPADVVDPAYADGSGYRRVGVVPVTMRYDATLALDASSTLVGGRWTGDPPDGPDDIAVLEGGPKLNADGTLAAADAIPWSFVRDLARASVDPRPGVPVVDLR